MKRLALLLLVLLAVVFGGLTIDATHAQVAQASPSAGVGGDGGGSSTYQPCDWRYYGQRIFMNDTDEGIFGIRYYRCVQGGGVIHWDRIHSAYFNTGGNYIQGAWNCWGGGCDEWIPD